MLWDFSGIAGGTIKNSQEMIPGIDTELPYTIAQNNDEFEKNILEFREEQYVIKIEKFIKDVELIFDGNASSRVADTIEYFMKQ